MTDNGYLMTFESSTWLFFCGGIYFSIFPFVSYHIMRKTNGLAKLTEERSVMIIAYLLIL